MTVKTARGDGEKVVRASYPLMSDASWDAVLARADEWTDAAGAVLSRPRKRIRHAALHALAWCKSNGFDLNAATVLDRDTIDTVVAQGLRDLAPSSRGTMRTLLLRIGEIVAPEVHPHRLHALTPSNARAPYGERELAELASWAATQANARRRRSAHAVLALGAGAGLSSGEILTARVKDVAVDDEGAVVSVTGERAREVPMISEWLPFLGVGLRYAHADDLIFEPGRRGTSASNLTSFIYRSHTHGAKPNTQRLRSTFLVRHIDAGTPMPLLMEAAGVDSLEALTRYLPFAAAVDAVTARKLLSL